MLSERSSLMTTACLLLSETKKVFNPFQSISSDVILMQFRRRFALATLSKALLKSNKSMLAHLHSFRQFCDQHDTLRLAGSLSVEPVLKLKKYV